MQLTTRQFNPVLFNGKFAVAILVNGCFIGHADSYLAAEQRVNSILNKVPTPPAVSAKKPRKTTKAPTPHITPMQNATRDELGINAWYVMTEGSQTSFRSYEGFVQKPDGTIVNIGRFEYRLNCEAAVNNHCTGLVAELCELRLEAA